MQALAVSADAQRVAAAEENGELKDGDRVILTGGIMSSTPGSTNLLHVYTVGEDR